MCIFLLQEHNSKSNSNQPGSPLSLDHKESKSSSSKSHRWNRSDAHQTSLNKGSDVTVSKTTKYVPTTVFKPKNLTFNFAGSGYNLRDKRRLSLGGRNSDPNKPITHSTMMNFLDFQVGIMTDIALTYPDAFPDQTRLFAVSMLSVFSYDVTASK